MIIAVIDGMGGGIGAEIISQIKKDIKDNVTVIALGTNASATERMMQAKATRERQVRMRFVYQYGKLISLSDL